VPIFTPYYIQGKNTFYISAPSPVKPKKSVALFGVRVCLWLIIPEVGFSLRGISPMCHTPKTNPADS
jgi:hypothetical protein